MATIITNKNNLPNSFVNAVKVDRHVTNGDISVTQLIDAPQVRLLRKNNDIEEDVLDRVQMLMGTALHHILELADIDSSEARDLIKARNILKFHGYEKASDFITKVVSEKYPNGVNEDILTEQNLTFDCKGWTISGTVDRIIKSEKTVQDYKSTSVYTYIYKENLKKYTYQLNVYALMAEALGIPVENLEVILYFKDWSKTEQLRNRDYPPSRVMVIPIKRVPNEQVLAYVERRVEVHQAAEGGEEIECTPKERWSSPDTFIVTHEGRKRALRKFTSREEAQLFIDNEGYKHKTKAPLYVDVRKGGSRRCTEFCPVANICPQRRRELEEKQNAKIEGDEQD